MEKRHPEYQYLDLLQELLEKCVRQEDKGAPGDVRQEDKNQPGDVRQEDKNQPGDVRREDRHR